MERLRIEPQGCAAKMMSLIICTLVTVKGYNGRIVKGRAREKCDNYSLLLTRSGAWHWDVSFTTFLCAWLWQYRAINAIRCQVQIPGGASREHRGLYRSAWRRLFSHPRRAVGVCSCNPSIVIHLRWEGGPIRAWTHTKEAWITEKTPDGTSAEKRVTTARFPLL